MNKKFYRAMTLGVGLLLAGNLAVNAQKVTFNGEQVSLKQAFEQIESVSKYKIAYNTAQLDVNRKVTLNQKDTDVLQVLDQLLAGTGCTYKVNENYIVITSQQTGAVKKVHGVVKDVNGEPIIGANVVVKGNPSNGTITDLNGNFDLSVTSNTTLQVSYIGYNTQELFVGKKTDFNIVLKEDTELLDEVVVVGYGTMKKKDLTGAVASVKMDDAPVGTVSTISHALAGKAAGLQVNTISAQPGSGSTFRIRGAASVNAGNDPLIIIDGFPVSPTDDSKIQTGKYDSGSSDNILASINPNDIESIEVLKDASSTAIYGARAGNGVIIITTKKGKTGAPKVTYSGTASVQTMAAKYEMLSAKDFMIQSNRYALEEWRRSNGIGVYGGKSEAEAATPYTPYYTDAEIANPAYDTDWFKEITRTGFQTQHNLSVNGGTEMTKYLISGNFFKQNGVVKNNDMDRYTARVNVEQKVSKYVNLGVNMTLSRNTTNNVPLGAGQNENASIMVAAAQFSPILPVRDEEGEYVLNSQAAFLPNPVSLLEITDKTVKERMLGTVYVEIKPIEELTLKGNFGIDRNYQKHSVYMPKTTLYGQKTGGQANIAQYDKSDYLMELTANYSKRFGDHNLNALVGYSFQRFTDESLSAGNSQFLIDGFLYNNLGAGAYPKPSVGSSASKSEMASFFGRINYSYKDRYLLTATMRADGASNFAKNNRWGYFPSVALGWRFTEEEFMQPLTSVLSNGKLRVSFGQTGNSNIGNRVISYYSTGNNNEFGGTEQVGVYLSQMGNVDLKWETTTEWNVGVDLGFFKNRLNVTAEYFHKVVSDLLSERSLLGFQEVSTIAANIGETQSQGFELTINSTNFNTKNFGWNTDFTFSLYRDKWKTRDESWKPSAYSVYDSPIRYQYGYLSDGLIQPGETVDWMPGAIPGQVKIKDINGYVYNEDGSVKVDQHGIPLKSGKPDGKLDDADKVIYGSSDPGYLLGLNNTFRWKNFDLNIYFYGQFDLLNSGSYKDLWLTGASGMTGIVNMYRGYNMPVSAKDVWTSDNQSAVRPGYFQDKSTWGIGDYYLQKSWFVRCRNITLGYTIPVNQGRNILSNVRVYFDVNNPFTITPYDGLDLETDNSVWAYPNVRSFSLGVDITF
ncbi:tonB-dependent receptor [Phocaeicola coprophilus CAG:333]|nr:TonB-dependent receptor [Phocaeicola coprophilus]CDC55739.1 tonB-dependent receptor [Phocaeicola coprophilus CAG:333]